MWKGEWKAYAAWWVGLPLLALGVAALAIAAVALLGPAR
jgi:hypothetical protein